MAHKPTRKTYRLRYQPPYDFAALLAFFGKRAIPSVERIDEKGYERDFALGDKAGRLRVEQGSGDALKVTIDFPDVDFRITGMRSYRPQRSPPPCSTKTRR